MFPPNISTVFRPGPFRVLLVLIAAWAAAPSRADEAGDQFAVAVGHYTQQRWKLAAEQFQAFLQAYPNHAKSSQSIFLLAEAFLQMGDTAKAGTHFRQYLNREPSGKFVRPARFRAGETAYLLGKVDLAKTDLLQFQSKYPDDPLMAYVLPYLGDITLGQGDLAAAQRHFREGLTRFPKGRLTDDCRFGLARVLEKQSRNAEAERLYGAVAAKRDNPLADDAQFHLGALQYATGKYTQAVKTFAPFETTLSESPWKPNARLGQGWALLKLNRPNQAKAAFESIVSDPKVGVEARYWLGITLRSQANWPGAAEVLQAAAAANPQHKLIPAIRFFAGDSLRRSGDTTAAIEQFDLAIASKATDNPWLDDATRGKIQAAVEVDDHPTVDREAAEFQQRFPQSSLKADVQRLHGRSLLKRKQYAEVLKRLQPLISTGAIDEQAATDRYLMAQAYEGLKRHEDALAVLLPVVDATKGRLKADAQLVQGSALLAMQQYSKAVEPLEAFVATKPSGDEEVKGRGELAICYARTGQLEKAKQQYAGLLQKHADHPLIIPTTEQLAEAAFDADDFPWSTQLFHRLESHGGTESYVWKGLFGVGWSQFKAEQFAEAAATLDKLLKKNPPEEIAAEAALVCGKTLERLNPPGAALNMYDLVIDKYPKSKQHPEALLAAGRLNHKLQQDREAAELYERLAKEYPELNQRDVVLYEWAWVLDNLGQAADSIQLFEQLSQQYPKSRYWADATYRLTQQAFGEKDFDRAKELAAEVLAAEPDGEIRAHVLNLQGRIAAAEEDWKQVATTFSTLLKEFPGSSSRLVAEFWIAESSYRQADYETARKRFDRLARQATGRRGAWLGVVPLRRAQVASHQKKWNEAYAIVTKIEAAYPNFEKQYEVDYLIGRCLAARADLQGAREAYRKVIRSPAGAKTETAAMAQMMIGESYFHQENYEAALREFLQLEILYAYPYWQAMALLEAGKCNEKLGEHQEAVKVYSRLLKTYPDTPFAEQASQGLKALPNQRAETNR